MNFMNEVTNMKPVLARNKKKHGDRDTHPTYHYYGILQNEDGKNFVYDFVGKHRGQAVAEFEAIAKETGMKVTTIGVLQNK
jgi:hypothetical protein